MEGDKNSSILVCALACLGVDDLSMQPLIVDTMAPRWLFGCWRPDPSYHISKLDFPIGAIGVTSENIAIGSDIRATLVVSISEISADTLTLLQECQSPLPQPALKLSQSTIERGLLIAALDKIWSVLCRRHTSDRDSQRNRRTLPHSSVLKGPVPACRPVIESPAPALAASSLGSHLMR